MNRLRKISGTIKAQQIIKFLISGGSAAVAEYILFLTLIFYFGNELLIVANSISFLLGLLVSFFMNKLWVFNSRNSYKSEFAKYFILALVNVIIGGVLISVLANLLTFSPFVAKVIVMVLIACWNYLVFSKYIFGNK